MAFFDKLTELAKNVTDQAAVLAKDAAAVTGEIAKDLADKTGDLLEVGKLNGQIASGNSAITELKTRLGDHYWNRYVAGDELDEDAVVLCTTIKEYVEEIENLKAQVAELKAGKAPAVLVCPACGAANSLDALFCKNCGTKLEQVIDVEPTPVEEEPCTCGCCHHEGEEHECCCGHHEGEEHECCCGHHEGEEHECCCGHHEGEEHECCCGHHEGEEHECCCGHCHEEESVIEQVVEAVEEKVEDVVEAVEEFFEGEETVIEIGESKVCPNCGADNDDDNTYCNKCGAKL